MRKKKKPFLWRLIKFMFSRVVLVGLLILAQLVLLCVFLSYFQEYSYIFYTLSALLSFLVVCRIIKTNDNSGYKIAWIIIVCMASPFGAVIYYIFSGSELSRRVKKSMSRITSLTQSLVDNKADVLSSIAAENSMAGRQSNYINKAALCPPYRNTGTVYYPSGEAFFEAVLQDLEKAERYIFLEYFIIARGKMWDRIYAILKRKAAEGVDVRVIYDDFGSIMRLGRRFPKQLHADGVKCYVFHRFVPVLDARQNNRDHRKICVIDGHTAYTGGVNLADEYINAVRLHGHWKDNAIRIQGEAAWSFTMMFLTMWDYLDKNQMDRQIEYDAYRPSPAMFPKEVQGGYVQPYTDNPLDNEAVGETIYLHLLYHATHYVWITTPYLIIDEQMKQALCQAAKSGVDVRIITPGIPDKKTVYETTRSYYADLIQNGVKVYEYTPGFIHGKTFICDDLYATVGSVNLDFRSLYLHFECGLWMYQNPAITDIKKDYLETLAASHQIQPEDCRVSAARELLRSVLKIIAPIL